MNNKEKPFTAKLFEKFFSITNINKILIIFIVGFISRILINYIYKINVFTDYFSQISIMYYLSMSIFIVLIHDLITYFEINIIPNYVFYLFSNVIELTYTFYKNMINTFYNNIINAFNLIKGVIYTSNKIFHDIKWDDFTISFFIKLLRNKSLYTDFFKLPLNDIELNESKKILSTLDQYSLNKNRDGRSGNSKDSSKNNDSYSGRESNTNNRTSRRNRNNNLESIEYNRNNRSTPLDQSNEQNNRPTNNEPIGFFELHSMASEDLSVHSNPNFENNPNKYHHIYEQVANNTTYQTPDYHQTSHNPYPTIPKAPNPYTNLSTPSSTAPTFKTHTSEYRVDTPNNEGGKIKLSPPPLLKDRPIIPAYRAFNIPTEHASNYNNYSADNPENNNNRYYASNYGYSSTFPKTNYVSSYAEPTASVTYPTLPNNYELPDAESSNTNYNGNIALINNPRPRQTYVDSNDINWSGLRSRVQNNVTAELRGYSSKEVVIPKSEIVIPKQGLLGRLKLGFKYLDEKMHNIDTVYVSFRDKSKRKFVWTLWEKSSGMYESYEDFKSSWDPKTSIWEEIKNRTRKDMRTDIEGILGVNKRTRVLNSTTHNTIKSTSRTTKEVTNLINTNNPFNNETNTRNINYQNSNVRNNIDTNIDETRENTQPEGKHRRKHRHVHSDSGHSHSRHKGHHSSRHGHSSHRHRHHGSSHANSSHRSHNNEN